LEFLAVGARGKRGDFSPGAAHTESPPKTFFLTFFELSHKSHKWLNKWLNPKKCVWARGGLRSCRAPPKVRNSRRRIFALYCICWGSAEHFDPRFQVRLDPAPFHPNKHVFFEKSAHFTQKSENRKNTEILVKKSKSQ